MIYYDQFCKVPIVYDLLHLWFSFCAVFGPQCHEVIAFSTALRTSKALSCFFLLDISCDSTSSLLRESALQLRISKLQQPESVFGCSFKIAGMQLQYHITIYTHAILVQIRDTNFRAPLTTSIITTSGTTLSPPILYFLLARTFFNSFWT